MRRLLCHEPRGHADMYGGFLVPPDDDGADLGVLFWHKDGYSTACGHGTIALGAWAVESGRVAAPADGEVEVTIDVPSGRVVARVRCARRRGRERRVPQRARVRDRARASRTGAARAVDVAYGGAIYAFVRRRQLGLRVVPDDLPRLIARGREVKARARRQRGRAPPEDERLSGIYGTVFHEDARAAAPAQRRDLRRRRGRPLADAARRTSRAHRAARRRRPTARRWRNDSIVGTTFHARAIGGRRGGGVLTEVEGTAYRTGEHRFVLDPRDPLGTGFVLR